MRAVVQRVTRASVSVDGVVVGAVGRGFCVLVGASPEDTSGTAEHLADRVAALRVFADAAGKMNLDAVSTAAEVLVVSQFTLYADTSRGHRPSFVRAAAPEAARALCEDFARRLRAHGLRVETGRFGASMAVELVNDGPVTVVLSSGEPPWAADAG